MKGIWISLNDLEKPDIVIYYAHGSFLRTLCSVPHVYVNCAESRQEEGSPWALPTSTWNF